MFVCESLNQSKPKTSYFLFVQTVYPNQTKPNQTFSTINSKLTAWNKIKSKVPEKLARAAQLLYRPVLVLLYQAQNSSKNSVVLSDFVFWRSSVEKMPKVKCIKINGTPCTFTLISSSMLTAAHATWSINNIMKFLN